MFWIPQLLPIPQHCMPWSKIRLSAPLRENLSPWASLKTHPPASTDSFVAVSTVPMPSYFTPCPSWPPNCKFLHKASKRWSIIHSKCHGADDNSPDMNYKWELPLLSCVQTPFPLSLPCSTPTTSLFLQLVTVIPTETGGCWAIDRVTAHVSARLGDADCQKASS